MEPCIDNKIRQISGVDLNRWEKASEVLSSGFNGRRVAVYEGRSRVAADSELFSSNTDFVSFDKRDCITACWDELLDHLSGDSIDLKVVERCCDALLSNSMSGDYLPECQAALIDKVYVADLSHSSCALGGDEKSNFQKLISMIIEKEKKLKKIVALLKKKGDFSRAGKCAAILKNLRLCIARCAANELEFNIKIDSDHSEALGLSLSEVLNDLLMVSDKETVESQLHKDMQRSSVYYELLRLGQGSSVIGEEDYSMYHSLTASKNSDAAKQELDRLYDSCCKDIQVFSSEYSAEQSDFLYRFILSMIAQGGYAPIATALINMINKSEESLHGFSNYYLLVLGQDDRGDCNVEIKRSPSGNLNFEVSAQFPVHAKGVMDDSDVFNGFKWVKGVMHVEFDTQSKDVESKGRVKVTSIEIKDETKLMKTVHRGGAKS